MARDRQRAKQRKARREKSGRPDANAAAQPENGQPQEGLPADHLARADLSGELEHMTADVDQFDAALVAGAEGVPAEEGAELGDGVVHPEALDDDDFAELEDRIDEVEQAIETGDQEHIDEVEHELDEDVETRKRQRAAAPTAAAPVATKKGPGRFIAFLRASWAELRRVQWPDRRAVGQATAVVLGFVLVAGLYLGLADALAKKIVDLII